MQNIEVEVTLTGGQRHSCLLPSNSELLHDLYVCLATAQQGQHQPATILQIPLDDGKAACSFMSSSLVSVITRPAVLVQPQDEVQPDPAGNPSIDYPAYVRIDDFLTPDENGDLLNYAIANEQHFEGSKVITDSKEQSDDTVRKSRVLFAVKDANWRGVFIKRIKLHLPHIASALGVQNYEFDDNEIQLTASNDGDFFKRHADSGQVVAKTTGRIITFVYYFHKLPKPYSGGDFLLYGRDTNHPQYCHGSNVTAIAPVNNCLVAFASHQWHEVDMVRCPSGEFSDSRFTINGWLRRGSA